jgi:excisionase family DNA binding protein
MADNVLDYLQRLHRYLAVSEVAKLLRKHPETIYRHIKEDGLPAIKDGRRWKIDSAALADWYGNRTTRNPPSPRSSMEVESKAVQNAGWPRVQFATGRDRHQAVNAVIFHIYQTTGQVITRKDIWKLRLLPSGETAGYKTKSDFNTWQRGAGTQSAARYFARILTGKLRIF